jgi:lambda repressor-like predicted transcriptional regulator
MSINENINFINRKVMLAQKNLSISGLAKKINYTSQSVNEAILGRSTSYRCHKRIAAFFGKSLVEIWPELYSVVPSVDDGNDESSHIN